MNKLLLGGPSSRHDVGAEIYLVRCARRLPRDANNRERRRRRRRRRFPRRHEAPCTPSRLADSGEAGTSIFESSQTAFTVERAGTRAFCATHRVTDHPSSVRFSMRSPRSSSFVSRVLPVSLHDALNLTVCQLGGVDSVNKYVAAISWYWRCNRTNAAPFASSVFCILFVRGGAAFLCIETKVFLHSLCPAFKSMIVFHGSSRKRNKTRTRIKK